MRIQDIIRSVLDAIDTIDAQTDAFVPEPEGGYTDDDIARFKQIAGITNAGGEASVLANSPQEKIADITAVTVDAGGGVNGPKHPHDLRLKDPSMYPNQQEV